MSTRSKENRCKELTNQPLVRGTGVTHNTILNLVGQIAPLLAAIGVIPFLIRGLGTSRFGVLSLVWVVIGYFSFLDLGLGRALTQLIAERLGNKKISEIPSLIWTSLFLMLALGTIGSILILFLAPKIVYQFLNIPVELHTETLRSLYLLSFAVPIIVLNSGFRGVLEAGQHFGVLTLLRIPYGIFVFVSPLFVLTFSQRLDVIVIVAIAGRAIFCLAHVYFCFKLFPSLKKEFQIKRRVITPLFQFSSWMTITNIVGPLMVYLDRFFISVIFSVSAVAYYATPFEIVTKLLIVSGALVGVLFPVFATNFVQDRAYTASLFVKGIKYTYLILFPIVLVLVALGHEGLQFWLGDEYAQNSTRVLQILAIGVLINSIAQIPFALLQGIGRPDLTAKIHLAELPLYLLCLFYLSRPWGINGVALIWLGRVFIDAMVLLLLAYRIFAEQLRHLMVFTLASTLTIASLILMIFVSGLLAKILLVTTLLIIFSCVSWNLFLSMSEQAMVGLYFRSLQSLFRIRISS